MEMNSIKRRENWSDGACCRAGSKLPGEHLLGTNQSFRRSGSFMFNSISIPFNVRRGKKRDEPK